MSLKSVKTMPALSTAAKVTIINTIADNALASFVVIQVGRPACSPRPSQLHHDRDLPVVVPPVKAAQCRASSSTSHAVTVAEVQHEYSQRFAGTPSSCHTWGKRFGCACYSCFSAGRHPPTQPRVAAAAALQVAIRVSRLLGRYARRPDLTARMPGFSVQMGFGLHVGWAIEGAIGEQV
jgi:hypothetical protein